MTFKSLSVYGCRAFVLLFACFTTLCCLAFFCISSGLFMCSLCSAKILNLQRVLQIFELSLPKHNNSCGNYIGFLKMFSYSFSSNSEISILDILVGYSNPAIIYWASFVSGLMIILMRGLSVIFKCSSDLEHWATA